MSEFEAFDLDRSTGRAWRRFQARLADHVAAMRDDDVLVVSADSAVGEDADGAAPYVQFCAWGQTLVRAEVSSNAYLAAEVALDGSGYDAVAAIGWARPTLTPEDEPDEGSANFFVDLERAEADRLAVMSTQVLRQVFGVPHPAFLSADGWEPDLSDDAPVVVEEPVVESPATFPDSREHLLRLVDEALTPVFGQAPEHDEDDDIPVVSGTALAYVRVLEQVPGISLFCALVHGVADRDRAAFEVAVLNRDERFLKFVLDEDRVMAQVFLPAYPFAPEQLRTMLAILVEAVDTIDDDLVARVGGRRTFEPVEDRAGSRSEDYRSPGPLTDEELHALLDDAERLVVEEQTPPVHPAMTTLLELDADEPGSLTPELAASVCSGDRDLLLDLIAWSSEQEIAWRRARDAALTAADTGDRAEAGVCEREADRAQAMVELLRRTLRLVVERQLGRDRSRFGYLDARHRSQTRTRPDADRPLPGLEPPPDEPDLFDEG